MGADGIWIRFFEERHQQAVVAAEWIFLHAGTHLYTVEFLVKNIHVVFVFGCKMLIQCTLKGCVS